MNRHYNQTIGYSPLDCVDPEKMRQVIRVNKTIIDQFYLPKQGDVILVAGAGTGEEAAIIQDEFGLETVGVDLNIDAAHISAARPGLRLQKQDLMELAFGDDQFSLIYSYHVLEHVADHKAVLRELHRVLNPGGLLFIGFPNRNRVVSYIGTSQRVSMWEKFRWNANDYRARLKGGFENKFGAHAGFTQEEFLADSSAIFGVVRPVRNEYMLIKYRRHHRIIELIIRAGLAEIAFPSNYYVCSKKGAALELGDAKNWTL